MNTIFDFLTVACFISLVCGFFLLTERRPKTLAYLLIAALVFSVADQLGNAGSTLLAAIMIAAGVGYTVLIIRG
jgi:predicted branched-subunit amino acid permease